MNKKTEADLMAKPARLSIVRQPAAGNWRAVSAAYSRVANSALIGQITFATNGVTMMNMTKGYDALNRLTNIAVFELFTPASLAL